jgi:MFS family permease
MTTEELVDVNYDYTDPDALSFHNYIDRLDLECAPHSSIGLLGSAYFTGWALASVFVTRSADMYGRKSIFIIAMGL